MNIYEWSAMKWSLVKQRRSDASSRLPGIALRPKLNDGFSAVEQGFIVIPLRDPASRMKLSVPSREVVDAVAFLLTQHDASDFRRRAKKLVKEVPVAGTAKVMLDYSNADRYVLKAARDRQVEIEVAIALAERISNEVENTEE
ncbi:hypothetical protein PXH69_33915 [Rhodococcus qingshengii]|uniref:Uncharacterized protein n=1 Tax=Rhodococcus qingshengii TaxID=334542 RepID=A0AAW6LTE3_RHOSG|nr:hypothetical protein [Rhodococcus qingshengii]MDE8649964.1 hypothetical protein [Rhodococcus qingshengii]